MVEHTAISAIHILNGEPVLSLKEFNNYWHLHSTSSKLSGKKHKLNNVDNTIKYSQTFF